MLGCVTSSLAITGVSAFNSIRVESELLNEKKEKIRKEKEDLNNEFESLLSTRDLEISEEARAAINAISLAPLNMTYLEDLDITKENTILAYQDSIEIINHTNNRLYIDYNNSIDWDEATSVIYQNGISEENLDEVKEQVEWIEEFYNEVKSDFKDYDTKELACLLEEYFFKTSAMNGNIVATTSSDNIIFYPSYYKYSRFFKEPITKKEKFLLDILKSIKALDLFVNPDLSYLVHVKDKYPDICYGQIIREIKSYFISGLGKVYYNNLILLNEKYNLNLEDNTALTIIYWKLINNVTEGDIDLVDDETSEGELLYTNKDLSYLLSEYPVLKSIYSNSDIDDYHDIFVDYLSKKYNMDKNDVYEVTKDTSILDNNYQMPDVLGREKQEFYQWLWEDKSYEVDLFNSRELVKQR